MTDARTAEEQFYSRYSWCLNPALPVGDLLHRFQEEVQGYEELAGWQREESKANLYLFACAIACTVDDYFALHWLNVSPLANRFPQFRGPIAAAQVLMNVSRTIIGIGDHTAWNWRRRWEVCVARACTLLLSDALSERDCFEDLRTVASELVPARLPNSLLKRRMRVPEAFRCQDMAHQDIIALIERFCAFCPPPDQPTVIVGLRTAGAYFATLMAEYLKMRHWPQVSCFSIRPKNGVTGWEKQQLRGAAKQGARVLVVDDYPSTGGTIRMALGILERFAIGLERTVVLAPTHPTQPNWIQLAEIDDRIRVFTMNARDLHKTVLLAPNVVESLCKEYYAPDGCEEARVLQDQSLDELNAELARHSKDGHHVREKRVFALQLSGADGEKATKKVVFKSVGWGWLGYHAYIAGTRLKGLVPPVIGLRNGLLVSEWVDAAPVTTATRAEAREYMINVLASYVAARARRLPLTGDCYLESRTYRWTGSDEILDILRTAYGPYLKRLKTPALRKQLQKYVTALPTLVDGKMRRDEWIYTQAGVYKADFEHHNFGGGEPDIVDPAYDLAAAVFEFGLSKEAEQELVQIYQQESNDTSIGERILLHKILYGTMVMRHALDSIGLRKDSENNSARYHDARNFLIYSMNEFCAKLVGGTKPLRWSDSLFFLDLDGVFDQDLLGFPHATQSGLQSLALLRAAGFSVVLNTGRSVQHVRHYCDSYGLSGGIAEFGAVFVDAVNQREVPLTAGVPAEQLGRCREAIKKLPGVFTDPDYEYSIRSYRYKGRATIGLERRELETFLRTPEFRHLRCICRGPDSYIVQKRTSKAAALRFVRQQVRTTKTPITAIGDCQYDIEMLKAAEFAYAPGNCSRSVRQLAKQGKCRIVKERFQNGLLAAVRHRLCVEGAPSAVELLKSPDGLMQTLLKAADHRIV